MAIIKCKMCGGDLNITEGMSVAECEYCGTKQTVPNADSEKKTSLFLRAEKLRRDCDFDRAAAIYDSIITDFPAEPEAYWGLLLCKYGIEYVDDPATGKKVPTCHRSSFDSVMEDENLEKVMDCADTVARKVYREEAKAIEEIRKGILEVSGKEPPYDIFICYKETDDTGERTVDSVLAQDVYDALTEKGYRVFFSRITLEDKLGTEYEPYIFAALNSAKVMLAFGTDYEHFNAVWVKNEWSRFLKLMAQDKTKHLIPCYKDVDAYDLPKEFQKLQAQDLGKVGAVQDLLRGIEKLLPRKQEPAASQPAAGGPTTESLLKRGQLLLEDGDWDSANESFDKVLEINPELAEAYLGKFCAAREYRHISAMAQDVSINGAVQKKVILSIYKADGNMGRAIRVYREQTNCGLKEGIDYVKQVVAEAEAAGDGTAEDTVSDANLKRALRYASPALKEEVEGYLNAAEELCQQQYNAEMQKIAAREEEARRQEEEAQEEARRQEEEKTRQDQLHRDALAARRALCRSAASCVALERRMILGVKADGTALFWPSEPNPKAEEGEKQRFETCRNAVLSWRNLSSAVLAPGDRWSQKVVGLRKDGRLKRAVTPLPFEGDEDWRDLVQVGNNGHGAWIGLRADGRVVFHRPDSHNKRLESQLSQWSSVTKLVVHEDFVAGLRSNGTVVYTVYELKPRTDKWFETTRWADMVDIACCENDLIGLRGDGTVVVAGSTTWTHKHCSDWTDIAALGTTERYIIGIREDGTVLTDNSKLAEMLSTWRDIAAVSEKDFCVVGVKTDGTLVWATTSLNPTLPDLSGWKLFDRIETLEEERKAAQKAYEEELATERAALQSELANLKGLFTGKRRKEIEARLAEIEKELKKM